MVNLVKRGQRWYADLYFPSTGKRVKKSLGTTDEKIARKLMEEIASEFSKQLNGYTLDDLIELYEKVDTNPRFQNAKITGMKYSEQHAVHVISMCKPIREAIQTKIPKLLNKKVSKITQFDCKQVRKAIYDCFGASRKSQYSFVLFKSMFSNALQEGWIQMNPCQLMKDIKYEKKVKDALEPEVIKALLSMKDAVTDKEAWAYMCIMATTGMRKSEVLALNQEQIYQGTITVDRSVKSDDKDDIQGTKWDVIRVFPLPKITLEIISDLKPNKKGRYFDRSRHWADKVIKDMRYTAMHMFPEYSKELSKMTAHILRHSLTTNLVATGNLSDTFISEYLGWEHQHMLMMQRNYTHLKASHLDPVAAEIDRIYG